jgi:hypothetical protein
MNTNRSARCILVVGIGLLPHILPAKSYLAISPYEAQRDEPAGEVTVYGEMIVQRVYDVQLGDIVRPVPILSLQYAGLNHREKPKNEPGHVEARAKCIAERLTEAWALLDQGGQLEIGVDSWDVWRLNEQDQPPEHPAIYVRRSPNDENPLRIMTIYPEDKVAYPWVRDQADLAGYILSLIRAHYLLFWKNEADIRNYESLSIDRTREGKIFKEIAIRALEAARIHDSDRFNEDHLRDALARVALPQRERLYRLSLAPPLDWGSVELD